MPFWTPSAFILANPTSAASGPGTPLDLVGSYGAIADGASRFTGAVNGTTNFNDPGASFSVADVGKYFIIESGGAANNAGNFSLVGQFTAFVDANNMTMSVTAPITASGLTYITYTTDNSPMIAAGLAALPGSTHGGQVMLAPHSLKYVIESPIILNNKQTLRGQGAWGVSSLRVGANFPVCTVAGGGFTTPALTATTFTVTVDAVPTWMQLPNALITNGVGVACVGGIEFTYTGTTGTTFTGCQTRFNSTTIAAGKKLSTFAVWVDQPGTTLGGFEQGLSDITIDVGGVAAVGGVYMPHAQETSGLSTISINSADNFGVRIAREPANTGQSALDYTFDEISVIMAASCDPNSIGIDAHHTQRRGMRGIGRCSVVSTVGTVPTKAGIRMNGFAGGSHGPFHIESMTDGVLIGDIAQTGPISIRGIERGGVAGTTNLARIGNTAGNIVRLEDLTITNSVGFPGTNLVKDDLNVNTCTETGIALYMINANGKVTTDSNTASNNVLQVSSTPYWDIPVAAADCSAAVKAAVLASGGYVCDGTADEVEINQAITDANAVALPAGGFTIHSGCVTLLGQQFKIAASIKMKTGITLTGRGKSYTTIVATTGATMSNMISLNGVSVERTIVQDFNLHGNIAGATSGDAISYDNTGGSFAISPDPIHRIRHIDIRNCSGSGIIDGSNCRGSIVHDIRIQGCAQHGVSAIGSDSKWSSVSVIACGTDDGAMLYHGFNVTGANAQFSVCKAAFQKGRGWLFDTVRGVAVACQAQDNWGAGLDIGANQNNSNFVGWVSDSNGMFPQGGIPGSDSGIYAQGGFFTLIGSSSDRGFATGNLDINGNYGTTQNYGINFRNDFASGCNVQLECRGNKTDSVTGGRATGDNHNILISSDTTVSQVVYSNLPLATGGTFTLTDPDSGQTTTAISWSGTGSTLASNIQTALRALAVFTTNLVNVTTGNFTYQSKITLAGSLAGTSRTPLTINGASLTGVGAPAAAAVLLGVTGGARISESRIIHGSIYIGAPVATPTDALINNSAQAPFQDTVTGFLSARVKDAAGTPRTVVLEGNVPLSTLTTKGDIYAATGAGAATRLPVGATLGNRLRPDSSAATGLKWEPHVIPRTTDAAAINSGNTGITLVSDDTLLFSIGASEVWYFMLNLKANTANITMDLKAGMTGPVGATAQWGAVGNASSVVAGWGASGVGGTPQVAGIGGTVSVGGANNADFLVGYAGIVINSTNAGTVTMQFAQAVADAGNLVIKAYSHLILWRLV